MCVRVGRRFGKKAKGVLPERDYRGPAAVSSEPKTTFIIGPAAACANIIFNRGRVS